MDKPLDDLVQIIWKESQLAQNRTINKILNWFCNTHDQKTYKYIYIYIYVCMYVWMTRYFIERLHHPVIEWIKTKVTIYIICDLL